MRSAPVLGPHEATIRRWLIEHLDAPRKQRHTARRIWQRLMEAEVDFGEFTAVIAGVTMKLYMFCLRLSHSGKAVHVAYANQSQESFLDGHVRAFEALGGVPVGMIRYDNLKPAVIRVALGRERLENPRFIALRSHYGYDSFYCLPGSTVCPARTGHTRRAAWRARSAGSAAGT